MIDTARRYYGGVTPACAKAAPTIAKPIPIKSDVMNVFIAFSRGIFPVVQTIYNTA